MLRAQSRFLRSVNPRGLRLQVTLGLTDRSRTQRTVRIQPQHTTAQVAISSLQETQRRPLVRSSLGLPTQLPVEERQTTEGHLGPILSRTYVISTGEEETVMATKKCYLPRHTPARGLRSTFARGQDALGIAGTMSGVAANTVAWHVRSDRTRHLMATPLANTRTTAH